MYIRVITQKTKKGIIRKYTQIVRSYRREDGISTNEVIAHLGNLDPLVTENLKAAFQASKRGQVVLPAEQTRGGKIVISFEENLLYLPLAVISLFFRAFGLDAILDQLAPAPKAATSVAVGVEALVCHRCLEPGSKLAFQAWRKRTALPHVIGQSVQRLNNTRVHRILDELAVVDYDLQNMVRKHIVSQECPRIIYLDLTDTWFEAGGGTLARRAQTKQGHRSKRKINIALLVTEHGLPLKWQLLPGALNETTILPEWIDFLQSTPALKKSVLIFDRGMPSAANFKKLLDLNTGLLFLTCIKSDAIPTYIRLDEHTLDQLQQMPDDVSFPDLAVMCQNLGLTWYKERTFLCDLGIVTPPKPKTSRQSRPPRMRMYLYFNQEIQHQKRVSRQEKTDKITAFIDALNKELLAVQQPRKEEPTRRKITRLLEKLNMLELYEVILRPYPVKGKTKLIHSFQIELKQKENMVRFAQRYDGLSLVVGHPELTLSSREAVEAYRQKDIIEANFRTIKSVLQIRPTFHWTDAKIKSHVTVCTLALLIERLIELKLKNARQDGEDTPVTAEMLFKELQAVQLNRLGIGSKQYWGRTKDSKHIRKCLENLEALHLLQQYEPIIKIDYSTL